MEKLFKSGCLILATMIFMFTTIPQNVNAEMNTVIDEKNQSDKRLSEILDSLDQETVDMLNELDKYLVEDEDGNIKVDIVAAEFDNVQPEILNVMNIFNDMSAFEGGEVTTYGFSLPLGNYGNYCGKGNKGGTPIDDLDRACQAHDRCFLGFNNKTAKNKTCNYDFLYKVMPIVQYTSIFTYKGAYARAALALFKKNI